MSSTWEESSRRWLIEKVDFADTGLLFVEQVISICDRKLIPSPVSHQSTTTFFRQSEPCLRKLQKAATEAGI